jgi:hypothetical protein
MGVCYACGASLPFDRVYRTTECPGCRRAVKVCLNCRFYEPGAHWDCRETISEPVRDKDRVNFCDYFELASGANSPKPATSGDAKKRLETLFGE